MPIIEAEATADSACVSTAPVFHSPASGKLTARNGTKAAVQKVEHTDNSTPHVPISHRSGSGGNIGVWWSLYQHNIHGYNRSSLCNLLWLLWVVAILSLSLIPVGCVMRFSCSAVGLLILTAVIPDDGKSVWPYCCILIIPILVFKSAFMSGLWTFSVFPVVFGVIPLVDFLVGVDLGYQSPEEQKDLHESFVFELLTLSVAPGMLAAMVYGAWITSTLTGSPLEFIGVSASVGAMSGIVGITAGHELCHRASWLERICGRFLLCLVSYGHFYVEHTVGHHKHVATDEDPATARFGENFYAFLPRVVAGEFLSACRIEAERASRKGLSFWQCEIPMYLLFSTMVCLGLVQLFGSCAVLFFGIQSMVAILLFESVNYLEHYGLERRELSPGVHERVQPQHSWDSPARFTNHILFKLQRHADHHAHAGKRYQTLQAYDCSPQLPAGYATMIVLAMIPPLWRYVMDPRVLAHRQLCMGQTFRHGPTPVAPVSSK